MAGVTVTAEYEGARVGRMGRETVTWCFVGQMFADAIGVEVGWRDGDKTRARESGMALIVVITSSSLYLA